MWKSLKFVIWERVGKGLFGKGLTLYDNKISDLSKFSAFADDKINVTEYLEFSRGKVDTLWEHEKMLITSISSFSHNVILKAAISLLLEVVIMR